MRIIQMIKYPIVSSILLPFKIYSNAGIKIRQGANILMKGRLTLGRSDKSRAIISRLPINIYFGKNANVEIGHSISIGQGVNLIVKDNAALKIGNNTYFTSDSHIEVVNSVTIGNDCAISWGITIIDSDHHQIISDTKKAEKQDKVIIGNKVWIGCNVTILKSTIIGNNCVVAAGSIVKGTFPDNSLIAGNPAKVVKQSIGWQ